MKKLLALLLLLTGVAHADTSRITRSSFTVTNDSAAIVGTYLMGIDVGAASAGGCLKVFNSTLSVNGVLVSSVSLATVASHWFGNDGIAVRGMFYLITGNTNGVTIIYSK